MHLACSDCSSSAAPPLPGLLSSYLPFPPHLPATSQREPTPALLSLPSHCTPCHGPDTAGSQGFLLQKVLSSLCMVLTFLPRKPGSPFRLGGWPPLLLDPHSSSHEASTYSSLTLCVLQDRILSPTLPSPPHPSWAPTSLLSECLLIDLRAQSTVMITFPPACAGKLVALVADLSLMEICVNSLTPIKLFSITED